MQELLGDGFECFGSAWIVLIKHLLKLDNKLWENEFSSMLDLVKEYIIVDVLSELGSMVKISALHSPSLRIYLGNWGMLGTVLG